MKRSVSEARFIADFVCGPRGRNMWTLYGPDMASKLFSAHACPEGLMFCLEVFRYSDSNPSFYTITVERRTASETLHHWFHKGHSQQWQCKHQIHVMTLVQVR